MTSVPPNIVRSDDEVKLIRDQRAKAQQAQAQAQAMQMQVQNAQALSQTKLEGDSALDELLGTVGR